MIEAGMLFLFCVKKNLNNENLLSCLNVKFFGSESKYLWINIKWLFLFSFFECLIRLKVLKSFLKALPLEISPEPLFSKLIFFSKMVKYSYTSRKIDISHRHHFPIADGSQWGNGVSANASLYS